MTAWSAAVLCGGASRRMGADKALLPVAGEPLAARVAAAAREAGAGEVFTVGGDRAALRALGLDARPDDTPGEGPLGGLITAIAGATTDIVVVLACDLVAPDAGAIRTVVDALGAAPEADAAVPAGDPPAWVHAAWRRRAGPTLAAAFAAGERAIHRAAAPLAVVPVAGLRAAALADADTPADLPGTAG